jgi:hypothetical protein
MAWPRTEIFNKDARIDDRAVNDRDLPLLAPHQTEPSHQPRGVGLPRDELPPHDR